MSETMPFLQTYRSIVLTNAEGKSFNITSMVSELSIYADIFSNTLSGEVLLADSQGSIQGMDLKGQEKLKVELSNNGDVEIKEFFVYSITDRLNVNQSSEVYKMHFVSLESIINENTRVYQAFTGTNSDAVSNLVGSYLATKKKLDLEATIGNYKFVMPSWTPFQAINWYSGRSQSQESSGKFFLFYESMEGFHFRSIESLMKQEPKLDFHYSPTGGTFHSKDPLNIREYEIVQSGNTLAGFKENNSTLWTSDLVRKKIVKNRFDSGDTGNGFGLNMKERRDVFGSNILIRNETRQIHSQTSAYHYDTLQERNYLMRNLSNTKVRFLVLGDRSYEVGQVVNLKLLSRKLQTKENQEEDLSISGKHLITGIRYIFKAQDFHCSMETVKIVTNGS